MKQSSPSRDRRSPSSSPDPLALTSSPPQNRSRKRSTNGSDSGKPTTARQRGLSRASRTSDRSGTRSPRRGDLGSYSIRSSPAVRQTNQLDDADNLSAGLPRSSGKRKESFEISAPTALIRSSSDGSLSPSKGPELTRPPKSIIQHEVLQMLQKEDETASAIFLPVESLELQPSVSSVPDTINPLHMLAFAAEGTLGEVSEVRAEAAESGDGDIDADADGETDIEDSHNEMQSLEEPSTKALQPSPAPVVPVPPQRIAETSPAGTCDPEDSPKTEAIEIEQHKSSIGEVSMQSQQRVQDQVVEVNEPAPIATYPLATNGMVMSLESSMTEDSVKINGLHSSSEGANTVPGIMSSIMSPSVSLPEPSRPRTPALEALDGTSPMSISPNQTPESLRHGQIFTEPMKDQAEDVTMVDPDVAVSPSKKKISSALETEVEMDTSSCSGAFVGVKPALQASIGAGTGGIDVPDKLQFMGAMGDRSLQRHLREMEKAALMQKKPEEVARSSASSIPTAEAKRRKLAPKPTQAASYAKPTKEELEVDGDIWKALALDEARERQAKASSAAPGKLKPKGKTGKAKKQQLEQAEASQNGPSPPNDLMDIDPAPLIVQDEPREKKKAAKRGARFESPAVSVSTTASNKKNKDQAVAETQPDTEEADDGVYCICKEPYDENRVMILCDGICNNWYHIECVELDPLLVPLVNVFICPDCNKDPSVVWNTTYLEKCLRDLCRQPRRQPLSKYCSQACGFHHMVAMMQVQHLQAADVAPFVVQAEEPEAYIIDHQRENTSTRIDCAGSAKRKRHLQTDNTKMLLASRQASLCQRLDGIKQQQDSLEIVIQKAEDLVDIQPQTEDAPDLTKKKGRKMSKTKQKFTADDSRPCGFDGKLLRMNPRLRGHGGSATTDVLDDFDDICLEAKKKCTRHSGWQRLRAVALELEHNNLSEEIQSLESRVQSLN